MADARHDDGLAHRIALGCEGDSSSDATISTMLTETGEILADCATVWPYVFGRVGEQHRRVVGERRIAIGRRAVALSKTLNEAPRVGTAIFGGERRADINAIGQRSVG